LGSWLFLPGVSSPFFVDLFSSTYGPHPGFVLRYFEVLLFLSTREKHGKSLWKKPPFGRFLKKFFQAFDANASHDMLGFPTLNLG